ncbi:hypothetical protein KUTeg_021669 [Tegillarca granosa]|uniref:Protein kinase domain-containing protein n=1 Tax=Tegillarca granosa TaxID=220873 RepID=A0ABQ9E9J1_TEGGR|nr:hypothetical protein KUTeg_021669 [Tegillarca granosa]
MAMEKNYQNLEFPFCEESSKYEKLAKIGQGTFGEVFKARDRKTRKVVAMKKFPITAIREIKILQLLRHQNVVRLIEICRSKETLLNTNTCTFYLIFEFCEHDLAGLLSNYNVKFSIGEIKKLMQQLLNGLYFIHSNKILHRDMKASNIAITKDGILKLLDFGLARAFSIKGPNQPNRYTNRVVTLWYRPPELLLGDRNYGPLIDLWGAGCIMAEMWTRTPIMQGNTEQHQIQLISHLCGSITPEVWPSVTQLELYNSVDLPQGHKRQVKERLKSFVKDQYALDLLDKLLTLDPSKRLDADAALNHDFFWCAPEVADLSNTLARYTTSMFEFLAPPRRMAQQRQARQNQMLQRPVQQNPDQHFERKLAKIGQGTFGEVFKARDKNNRTMVAMKKVLMENEKEGFPITALREIKILQLLRHENVVNLLEITRTRGNVAYTTPYNRFKSTFFLIFEFCEHDLAGLLSNANVKFNLGEIKNVMRQLLNGLYFIHSNKILHRDMKAANILITKHGKLKLADFGLARAFSAKGQQQNRYTNRVVTLWYRPPELLLGERNYGPPIDLWGGGCIMAEMWTRTPIMQGKTEQHQIQLISQLCGSITPEVWPNVDKLELYKTMTLPQGQKRKVKDRLRDYVKDQYALDLLDKLLCLDPSKRLDSDSALNHDFFWTEPLPGDHNLSKMLSQHTTSMFEYLAPPRRLGFRPGPQNQPRQVQNPNPDQHFERVF